MGCEKSKCKICGKEIKANNNFGLMFEENAHEEEEHPEIYKSNLKADLKNKGLLKQANDILISEQQVVFTPSKWDSEDFA